MAEKKPMFSKPTGVFLQLLGAVAVIAGGLMVDSGSGRSAVAILVGVGLLWLGRQTQGSRVER